MSTALDLRAERARIWENEAKPLVEQAEVEGRNLSAEEREKFDNAEKAIDELTERIERQERAQQREMELAASTREQAPRVETPGEQPSYDRAFWNWAKRGMRGLSDEERSLMEQRQQGVTDDADGGFLVPEGFMDQIQEALKWYGGVRDFAQVMTTSTGQDIPWPKMDETSTKGARIDENTEVGDQDVTFGSVTLKAFTYTSKIVKVSRQLLQDDGTNMESRLPDWLATRIGRILNEEMTTGDGSDKPQGVVEAASQGHEAAASDAISYEDIVELIHSVDPAYRDNAQFMFSDSMLKSLKKLTDDQDRPLWVPGVATREPDTILGYGYILNQDMDGPGSGNKSAIFGDGSYYIVRDVLDFTLLRLDERYADYLQVGFLGFSRHDGRAVFEGDAPFKYLEHPS